MKRTCVVRIVSIVLLVVLALPTLTLDASAGLFTSPVPLLSSDDFGSATVISGLPFDEAVDTKLATAEPGEPTPSCAVDPVGKTIWYSFTPDESVSVTVYAYAEFSTAVAAYTGNSLADLTQIGSCYPLGQQVFRAEAGTTYHFQVRGVYNEGGPLQFFLETTPPLQAGFWFEPGDPSVFDAIKFYDSTWDPAWVGFESWAWDLGDGASATGCCPDHRYAADGDYTVQLTVTTYDGRTASTSQTVPVRTHDVAIVKFSTPQAAKAGQTRTIVVGVRNTSYPERVQVLLRKSVPGGLFDHVGILMQYVPVRPSNRTTDFRFSYTFTPADASVGTVTFEATAWIVEAHDALPADNEAISAPAKVNP